LHRPKRGEPPGKGRSTDQRGREVKGEWGGGKEKGKG